MEVQPQNKNYKAALVALLVIVIIGAATLYTQQKDHTQRTLNEMVYDPQNNAAVPGSFKTATTSFGLSISFPSVWNHIEQSKSENLLGGLDILSPGTQLVGDIGSSKIEHYIGIRAALARKFLKYEDVVAIYRRDMTKATAQVSRQLIEERAITIDGVDAHEFIFTETYATSSYKGIRIVYLPDREQIGDQPIINMGPHVIMEYIASPEAFDQVLAEKIFATVDDEILKTYQSKLK